MNRRQLITLLSGGTTVWPLAAQAQAPKKIPRLCFLTFDPGTLQATRFAFFEGLRDLVVCKPTGRIGVVRIPTGWRLGQDDEPVDRDAFSDSLVPRHSDITAAIVIAIPRNIDDTAARFVGRLIELGYRKVDPGADRRAVSIERARCFQDVIAELTCRLVVTDHRPIGHNLLLQDAGPFDQRHGNATVWAATNGLNHPWVGESRRVSRTLQIEF
jgi:hypothetical protein